ncbi:MAG: glutamate--tRNA ligase [Candidatus Yanofskybacteria bacterium]|nr:glutamate--tRNA ligase [Candidatus Yanofskybacteria bacterium]
MTRVRIAPSPTGAFHVGNAQSALFNWLFARKNGGKFYVRIEDTDKERSNKESEENIIKALEWLDLKPDAEFIRQSDNLPKHRKLLQDLLDSGKAFYCYHTPQELEAEQKDQELKKEAPRHICVHKKNQKKEVGGIIRLAVDSESDRVILFDDQIRGKIEFKASLLGDFSIARAVDDPLYNFAVVADDSDMEITHVIRGEDHISNTPKQILIYEALGLPIPLFAHLPLLLGSDRSKLSKRHGGTATLEYQQDYLPEALINFLGSLSYGFSKEIISKEDMIEEFDLAKVHKSGAAFDVKKLNWINSQYIKQLPAAEFKNLTGLSVSDEAVLLITERLEKLSDVQNFDYFWKEPIYEKGLLKWPPFAKASEGEKKVATLEKSIETLTEVGKIIEKFDFKDNKDMLRKLLDDFSSKIGNRGLVYWPLRVALSGKEKSPDPVDIAFVLGKEKVKVRIDNAIKKLEN